MLSNVSYLSPFGYLAEPDYEMPKRGNEGCFPSASVVLETMRPPCQIVRYTTKNGNGYKLNFEFSELREKLKLTFVPIKKSRLNMSCFCVYITKLY